MFPLCHTLPLGLPPSVSQLGHVQVLGPLRDVHASVNVLGGHQRDTGDWWESQRCSGDAARCLLSRWQPWALGLEGSWRDGEGCRWPGPSNPEQ